MEEIAFEKQQASLPVLNFDILTGHLGQSQEKRHGRLLPNSVRGLVVGPSGAGKTNSILALITHPNGLRFENVYVYSKSLNQPKYKLLEDLLRRVEGVRYLPFESHEQVISPDEARPNSIFLFDDISCTGTSQTHVRNFFCMGRHKGVDSFYLAQTYAHIPKHLIRDNANFLVVFKQDDMNLKHIYMDHVNTDMMFSQFRDMCASCWQDHGFLCIDKDSPFADGRYRKGFDCFIKPINNPSHGVKRSVCDHAD